MAETDGQSGRAGPGLLTVGNAGGSGMEVALLGEVGDSLRCFQIGIAGLAMKACHLQ